MSHWDIQQASSYYGVEHWADDYFTINSKGEIEVRPMGNSGPSVSLYQVAQQLQQQDLSFPVLVRIPTILHNKTQRMYEAFAHAKQQFDYNGTYTPVYPIKVNQQRTVVENLINNPDYSVGLEAGSKPELMAVLALGHPGGTIICNGYKDSEYIRVALIGQQLGHRIFIVIEKPSELNLVIEEAKALNIKPLIGVRIRLSSIGKGKWQNTGGEKSKFGLNATQALRLIEQLKDANLLEQLQLLHCHIGSQLANIRDIQGGIREATRYFSELSKLGAPIKTLDVGGGLGVDYEGARSRSFCSMNYNLQEYANDVVRLLKEMCEEEQLPEPEIVTESGRAMTAHHAVLITNVVGAERQSDVTKIEQPEANAPTVVHNLWHDFANLNNRSVLETYHDAAFNLSEAQTIYNHGLISLQDRAYAETLYYHICAQLHPMLQENKRGHREILDELNEKMADKYFCNLSVFQSVPDVWAIEQIFPIIPLHRLAQQPTRRAILLDLSCDSDGAIEHYVYNESIETSLAVHELKNNEDYLLGIFLVGAYQEILGDLHNLFGDTHSVNLEIDAQDQFHFSEVEWGDNVDDVLRYVHFDPDVLFQNYREKIQQQDLSETQQASALTILQDGLSGYTYLEKE
ncbi:MAG: biosynthetic arginine decarboxylase [Gammaproteobacteria bacterium]|nr:biosynthetic arginine decarboxylase [Gammaproteobacteria bacterium]MDH5729401.1 biosynthetic arginine decarboxylase [Gammaproteobacteria bacterium]